jgi:LacI family transcriptional regulator
MKSSPIRRVRLSEVAAKAGTSVATVSYVLNETGAVGAETRARVLSATSALGYQVRQRRPKPSTRTGIGSVALIWVNTSPGWRQSHLAHTLIDTIANKVQASGGRFRAIFYEETENATRPVFDEGEALLVAGSPSLNFGRLLPNHSPRLNIICYTYPTATSFLDIDHVQAGYELTSHLLKLGHRRIGFVSNNRDHWSFNLRYLGYLRALDEAHVPLRPEWVVRREGVTTVTEETAQPIRALDEDLTRLLDQKERPTALFAANDWLAAAIYQNMQRRGLRVPQDISVVGCDDDPSICGLLQPGLTTHSVPYLEVAQEAAHWIIALMAGQKPHLQPGHLLLRGQLIERASTQAIST